MSTSNKYDDMSALEALKYVKNRNMLLPDIQREYVFGTEDIELLFESIIDDYPIGSLIFWQTNKNIINTEKPSLYYFITNFKSETKNDNKAPEVLNEDNIYYIVLDGQQRITSLNIALYGTFTYPKKGRGHARNNPKSWITKELYYNLDNYSKSILDEEQPNKRFKFLTSNEAQLGNYYKVKQLLAYDKLLQLINSLNEKKYNDSCINDLSTLFQRLNDSSGNGLIHFYRISEDNYDEALNIFVRVNSNGKKIIKIRFALFYSC